MPDDETVLIETGIYDPIAIALAESLLCEAEIPFFAVNQSVAANQLYGNIVVWWNIRVPADREAEAREILRSLA